jgi:hypothetical protein
MAEAHERKAKKILGRDWAELRQYWLEYVPRLSDPGQPPELLLHELEELGQLLAGIPHDQVKDVDDEIPGLRAGLLHEAIFLLHKSAHVMGASLVHVSQGMCTWSASSAYHSAAFAMRSVLNMLGITVIETPESGHFLIDIWSPPPKGKKGTKRPITMLARTKRIEARHWWAFFQRALSITANHAEICAADFRATILQSEFTDFARQRNMIHYRTNEWTFDDLHKCSIRPEFGAQSDFAIDSQQEDFSLRLSFGLVKM